MRRLVVLLVLAGCGSPSSAHEPVSTPPASDAGPAQADDVEASSPPPALCCMVYSPSGMTPPTYVACGAMWCWPPSGDLTHAGLCSDVEAGVACQVGWSCGDKATVPGDGEVRPCP